MSEYTTVKFEYVPESRRTKGYTSYPFATMNLKDALAFEDRMKCGSCVNAGNQWAKRVGNGFHFISRKHNGKYNCIREK